VLNELKQKMDRNRKIQPPLFLLIVSFLTHLFFAAIKRMDESLSQHLLKNLLMNV